MRLSLGLEARQVQVQKLAPRMIQSMEILQLPIMALQERIEQEMTENPLLEIQETDPDTSDESPAENPNEPTEGERELVVDVTKNQAEDFERLGDLDREIPDYFDETPRRSLNRINEDSDRRHDAIANVVSRAESLNDHLMHQLGESDCEPAVRVMAERIISTLDCRDGGYFRSSLQDLLPPDAGAEQLAIAAKALALVQSFDPPGVAARNLRECLLMQINPKMLFYVELNVLISDHLEDLRDNRLPTIEKATGYTIEQIQDLWEELRKLNPKPASSYAESYVATVTPDVSVDKGDDGLYHVHLEDDRTPTLFISDYYRKRLASGEATPEEREYIKRKINAAQWLIESIEQRRSTLTKVAQAIVDHQTRFLDDGPESIQPLKMQQIAERVGVHVTTVSRAVDDKWIQTPRGILPLKRFFVGGTQSDVGNDVAWDIVRIKLQELVDREDKQNPFSDDDLVKEFKIQGLNVARRTITKYRQKMNIPSSRQRRDWSQK